MGLFNSSALSSTISGGAGIIGSIASSLLGARAQAKAAQQQFEYQKQLNQQQNDYNTEMWEKNNEYNTASNVLQRYLDTGMNAGAAVQAMSGVNGISSSPQASSSPGVNVDYASGINAGSSAFGKSLDTLLQGALARKTEAEADIKETEAMNSPQYWSLQLSKMRSEIANVNAQFDNLVADTKLKDNQAEAVSETAEQTRIDNETRREINVKQIFQLTAQINKLKAEIQAIPYQINQGSQHLVNENNRNKIYNYAEETKRYFAQAQIGYLDKLGVNLSNQDKMIFEQIALAKDQRSMNKLLHKYQGKVNAWFDEIKAMELTKGYSDAIIGNLAKALMPASKFIGTIGNTVKNAFKSSSTIGSQTTWDGDYDILDW